jgi:TPR repeat protein
MKQGLTAVSLSAAVSFCGAQSYTVDLSKSQNGQYIRHFTVEAANHDPSADTPKKIAAINQSLAAQGDTKAAWELGLAYMQGYGVKQNLAQAEHWFEIGATEPGLKALVGDLHEHGEYFPKDLDAAAKWLNAAGRPADLFEMAQAYRTASPPETARAVSLYLALLQQTGYPEVRRAQMELGNFVLDGKYSAGDDVKGRALNLEWARIITQELLGQEEYKIAIDYDIGRDDVPQDHAMWLRFCRRAAAYNVDLAQHFYAEAIAKGTAPNFSGYDQIAWLRLASDKQSGEVATLNMLETRMDTHQREVANAAYGALVRTREQDGAYYSLDDPLRNISPEGLAAMASDDPDVQLRRAFGLETAAQTDHDAYAQAMDLYRTVRDHREMDIRFVLGRDYLNGTNGTPHNQELAKLWLHEAAGRGSKPAQALLATLTGPASR